MCNSVQISNEKTSEENANLEKKKKKQEKKQKVLFQTQKLPIWGSRFDVTDSL